MKNRFARLLLLIIFLCSLCYYFDVANAKSFGFGSKVIYLLPGLSVQGSFSDNLIAEAAIWAFPAQGVLLGNNIYHGSLLYAPEDAKNSATYGVSYWQFITNSIEDNGSPHQVVNPGFLTLSFGRRWQNERFVWDAALDVGSVLYLTFSFYFLM